ncbi:phosphatase PAP2 family protein [Crenobacter intestini]|uniref:Phosphatase PAP2 family protein n=2 Tax=Crenobacter intestini TaxID=2563443 RepID=A0A4T0UP59_9NEIS|nr:phosphatase PAP2 family protein [Crenobacter intestini]
MAALAAAAPLGHDERMWHFLTNAGDSAVTLPAALAIALAQAVRGHLRSAGLWLLLLGAGGLLVLASKLAFIGWGVGVPALRFTGVSGHSYLAAAVLPVLGRQLWPRDSARAFYGQLAGVLLALLVGVSRLMIGVHSVSEVASGLALGLWVSAGYLKACEDAGTLPMRRLIVAGGVLVSAGVLFGLQSPSHALVVHLAHYLAGRGHDW